MAYAHAELTFKRSGRTKLISLWKDEDHGFRWFDDLTNKVIRRIRAANSKSDAIINAWEIYRDEFSIYNGRRREEKVETTASEFVK